MTQGKKTLHILKSEPDEMQKTLMQPLSSEPESLEFDLYNKDEDADYENLIDLIFEYDQTITWW